VKRHDLIAVTVTDPREHSLPDVGFITLKDPETGEIVELDTRHAQVRVCARGTALEKPFLLSQ
jgi:hypothetical protein